MNSPAAPVLNILKALTATTDPGTLETLGNLNAHATNLGAYTQPDGVVILYSITPRQWWVFDEATLTLRALDDRWG